MVIDAVEKSGQVQLFENNILAFDDFIKVQFTVNKIGLLIISTQEVAHKAERRALLKEKKDAEYQKCFNQFKTQQSHTFASVSQIALSAFKVPMSVFKASSQHYMLNPETAAKISESNNKIVEKSQTTKEARKELTREEALELYSKIYDSMVDAKAQI